MKCKKLLIFFLSLSFCSLFAQTGVKERIPVELRVAGIGNTGIEVIVVDTTLYLPAITVLSFIGIKNSYSPEELKIEGFYKTTSAPYEINCSALEARLKKIRVQLTSFDYLIENGELFLRMEFMKIFFELEFRYNKRRLVIELSRVPDLPKVKYVERQKRIEHLEASKIVLPQPDVTIDRTFSIYDGGRLSWNVFNRYSKRRTPSHHYNLNFGSGLLGGDLYMRLYGIERERKPFQQFRTQWRVPIFEQPLIRQITIGDVTTGGIESRLVRGVEITNRPFQQRYLFGYEDYDGYFNPNIDVELKNTQADYEYSKTDTSGKYYFNVPIYYGQGILDIKSYDPWGFQESERYRMNVPYTLIPPGTAEYSIVGGKTKYTLKRYSSTANVQWGVTSNLTIGSSIDYIDFTRERIKFYPSITSLARINSGLIIDLRAAPTAYSRVRLQWLFPSDAEINASATYYAKNYYFNPFQLQNRFDISTRIPIFSGTGFQLLGSQSNHKYHRYRNGEISFYTYNRYISPRFTTRWYWRIDDGTTSLLTRQSILNFSFTLPLGLFIYAEGNYNHIMNKIELIGIAANKVLFNSLQISASYYRAPVSGLSIGALRLQYIFPFIRVNAGATQTGPRLRDYTTGSSGTIYLSTKPLRAIFENQTTNIGYGGIRVNPFFDINNNGTYDAEDQKTNVGRINFGNVTRQSRIMSIPLNSFRLMRLPAYEEYDFALDPNTLENPNWAPVSGVFRIYTEPNRIRQIDIPLVIGGTIQGTIRIQNSTEPPEGIKVILKSAQNKNGKKYSTTTFSTGEYEFASIPPGKYRIELDDAQLKSIGYKAEPSGYDVEVKVSEEGDVITGKDFELIIR